MNIEITIYNIIQKIILSMRTKRSDQYQEERESICLTILELLELDEQRSFLLCDLDTDISKQQRILDLKEEIQKVFACSTISTFKPNFECKRPYLNMIRSILRQQNYTFIGNDYTKKNESSECIGSSQKTTRYFVFRS